MKRDLVVANVILNLKGETKGYVLWNGTESYYEKLRVAYTDIANGKQSEYLYFSFFTLCAATLEYSLNSLLTNYCLKQYGHEVYKPYAEGYINISFPKKLLMTASIISNGTLKFNEDSSAYKTLCELISLRNKILHNKDFLKTFDTPPITLEGGRDPFELQIPMEPNHIDTLDRDKCVKFGKALGDFKNMLMDPALDNDLQSNEILLKI